MPLLSGIKKRINKEAYIYVIHKLLVVSLLISVSATILVTISLINKRLHTAPYEFAHDGVIQTEEAVKMLLRGENPYTENYFNTPLAEWGDIGDPPITNPALYHLAYMPFSFIFSVPFFLAGNFFLGWFDERLVLIFSFLLVVALILKWPGKPFSTKTLFITALTMNPWFFFYFIEGRNDIFVLSWIILSIYFLQLEKFKQSSLALAFAVASKQTSWFLLPFYFAYLYYNESPKTAFSQKIKNIFLKTRVFFATAALIIVPFLIWDYNSFIDDIFRYSNGTAAYSYPIGGGGGSGSLNLGFSQLVLKLHLVSSPSDYWPFWIPQAIVCLPLLYVLLKLQKKNNSLGQMVFNFSLLLTGFWSFARFFNNNYLGFLIILFLFAAFVNESLSRHKGKYDKTACRHT